MPDDGAFLQSLTETSLFSIGAYFEDTHPDLVESVLTESERIERDGLAAYAREEGITPEAAYQTLVTGLAVRYHRAVSG